MESKARQQALVTTLHALSHQPVTLSSGEP
jgi:hypothetical protein